MQQLFVLDNAQQPDRFPLFPEIDDHWVVYVDAANAQSFGNYSACAGRVAPRCEATQARTETTQAAPEGSRGFDTSLASLVATQPAPYSLGSYKKD